MLQGCFHQVRVGPMGGVVGLDFTAILPTAGARGAALAFIAELLPQIEPFVFFAWRPEEP